jgi:hypothetical protein
MAESPLDDEKIKESAEFKPKIIFGIPNPTRTYKYLITDKRLLKATKGIQGENVEEIALDEIDVVDIHNKNKKLLTIASITNVIGILGIWVAFSLLDFGFSFTTIILLNMAIILLFVSVSYLSTSADPTTSRIVSNQPDQFTIPESPSFTNFIPGLLCLIFSFVVYTYYGISNKNYTPLGISLGAFIFFGGILPVGNILLIASQISIMFYSTYTDRNYLVLGCSNVNSSLEIPLCKESESTQNISQYVKKQVRKNSC